MFAISAWIGFWLILLTTTPLLADNPIKVEVSRTGKTYTVAIDAIIQATPASVYASLTDYEHLTSISPAIRESSIVKKFNDNLYRIRTVLHLCILIICKDLVQVQDMQEYPDNILTATIIPEASDFDHGHAKWSLFDLGDKTKIEFRGSLTYSFWIPPIIGPFLAKRMLRREVVRTVTGLQVLYVTSQ